MRAAFIHDHVFPVYDNTYYCTPGFDNSFMNRYVDIFGHIRIIARHKVGVCKKESIENKNVSFYTIASTKQLLKSKFRKELEQEMQDVDYAVIRVPSVFGIIASSICRKKNIPYLVEVVGYAKDALLTRGKKWKIPAYIFDVLTKNVVAKAKYVVYVTDMFLQEKYPCYGRSISCSNVALEGYYDFDIETKSFDIMRKNDDIIKLGTCAMIGQRYKGQDMVIHALKLLEDENEKFEYQLVGGGNNEWLKCLACELEVDDKVKFLGEKKQNEIFDWMDDIDIYIQPSRTEGLCRTIIEAMSRGCPIISSDVGGAFEQIDSEYIFHVEDIEQLANMIKKFDKQKRTEQSKRNYHEAEKYCSQILYERRKEFFNRFINENKRGV